MPITEFTLRLLCAMGAGFLIGLERDFSAKPAGLRTNMLVSVGSAFFVLLSIHMTVEHGDVTRIIGQVVTGVGFLGAGIIFKEGFNIRGLTTAATVWCSSAVGCIAAAGLFFETLIATSFIITINFAFLPLDIWLSKKRKQKESHPE